MRFIIRVHQFTNMKKLRIYFTTVIVAIVFLMNSCVFMWQQQQQQMYAYQPKRWCYVMCIKHATKDISINCLNSTEKWLSLLSFDEQQKTPEFHSFSNFGRKGSTDIELSWLPDVTNTLYYVVNEITLHPGEEIKDFNGFTIKAKNDYLLISNGKKNYRIKEKKDWSDIESKGTIKYGGHRGGNPLFPWHLKYWLYFFGLSDSDMDFPDPKNIKDHRFLKWCLSPTDNKSSDYIIYTMYIPHKDVVWRKRKVWYDSTWK